MKERMKKIIAAILSLSMVFSTGSISLAKKTDATPKAKSASETTAKTKKAKKQKKAKTKCRISRVAVTKKNVVIVKNSSPAYYKDAAVEVKDENGTTLEAKIIKKAKGNIKVKVTSLEKGKKYTITIDGVKTKKEKDYASISRVFTAK